MSTLFSYRLFLLTFLGFIAVAYIFFWVGHVLRSDRLGGRRAEKRVQRLPTLLETALGFVTNFFDTLGIGSFAPTASVFKLCKLVPDERVPGTLNVGHAIPTFVEALVFISIISVDVRTLVAMITASVIGAWFGAGVVARWPRRRVQFGMGAALLAAASFFLMTNLGLFPAGGETLSLTGLRLWVGLAGNLLLGAFMTLGIGLYAPCMILVSLLGMNPKAAFPIMMGSCAFLMPVAGVQFIRKESYALRPALGLALGGIPGVLIAAFIVKSLSLKTVRWLVLVVVVYAALAMLRSAAQEKRLAARAETAKTSASPTEVE